MRNDLNYILTAIDQASLTDGEYAALTIPESPSRLQMYQAVITVLGTRDGVGNALTRLKDYAYATDQLDINISTGELAAVKPQSNVFIGAVLE